jgi:hypothetical protein
MENEYTLKDALDYAEKIEKIDDLNKMNPVSFIKSIKVLAENDDKVNFKRMTDKYLALLRDSKYEPEVFKKGALSFLEFLCAGIDHGYSNIMLGQKIEAGKIQRFYQEVYSLDKINKKGPGDYFG